MEESMKLYILKLFHDRKGVNIKTKLIGVAIAESQTEALIMLLAQSPAGLLAKTRTERAKGIVKGIRVQEFELDKTLLAT